MVKAASKHNKKEKEKTISAKRRIFITFMVTIFCAIVVGCVEYLRQRRVPDMHIIIIFVIVLSGILVTYLILWTLGAFSRFAKAAKILKRCYYICLIAGIVGFIVLQGLIISGTQTEQAEVDAIIVLGAGLRNGEPSIILRTRLNAAIEYLEGREGTPIIVTGGLGQGETITEAEAMFNYLRRRGIDEEHIWKEDASTSTYENLAFSREIMIERGIDVDNARIAIVSNEFHLFRAKMLAGNAGLDAVGVAAQTPTLRLRVFYHFREGFSLANALVF